MFFVCGVVSSLRIHFVFLQDLPLENATYTCPWAKAGMRRSIPTVENDWPWDLLIIIAKDKAKGNWWRWRWNGSCRSAEISLMRGIRQVFPSSNTTSTTLVETRLTIPLVPLQIPLLRSGPGLFRPAYLPVMTTVLRRRHLTLVMDSRISQRSSITCKIVTHS